MLSKWKHTKKASITLECWLGLHGDSFTYQIYKNVKNRSNFNTCSCKTWEKGKRLMTEIKYDLINAIIIVKGFVFSFMLCSHKHIAIYYNI